MIIDGNKIRHLREDAEMTQGDLAQVAAVTPSAISYLEAGKRSADIVTLRYIADHFGVKVDDLLKQGTA